MDTPTTTRATAAAVAVATSLGLTVDRTTVLHSSNKLAVRLTPCDVVARVAAIGAEVAQFEVDLTQQLSAAGCPVGALEPRVEPEVYRHDGFAVTLWTYYEPVTPRIAPPAYAEALHRLHAGLHPLETDSPHFTTRVAEAVAIAADPGRSPELPAADRALLSGTLASLHRAIADCGAAEQLLHGEPHPGNVLSTRHGPLFIDWETCCRGPVEFDLAHVPEEVCAHYPGVDRDLVELCRHLVVAMVAAWRWDRDDLFPDGRWHGIRLLRVLRAGPPWPSLDAIMAMPAPAGS